MLDRTELTIPIYGEAAYLSDAEHELVARTRGHRLAVMSDDELAGLVHEFRGVCDRLRPQTEEVHGDAGAPREKLCVLISAMQRASVEADRRNQRLAAADLNAFAEDLLGVDLDQSPQRRGSAEKFAKTVTTRRASERRWGD